jgi:hypothetical protein
MIDKLYGSFHVFCDICGHESPGGYTDFYEAVAFKKQNGWRSKKKKGEWLDCVWQFKIP